MSKKIVQEKDIQQARWDCKWKVLPEMVDTWAAKATDSADEVEFFRCIIYGESILETCLEEKEGNFEHAKKKIETADLKKSSSYFMKALQLSEQFQDNKQKANVLELYMLLAKCHYMSEEYQDSMRCIESSKIETENILQLSKRGYLLAAETYSFKGQILEHTSSDSTDGDIDENIVQAYRKSAEICLWLFADGCKTPGARKMPDITTRSIPERLFSSFTKPAEIEIKKGHIYDAVDHYRTLLRAVETKGTKSLRKVLAVKLAELIMVGMIEKDYVKPPMDTWINEDRINSPDFAVDTYQGRSFSTSSSKATPKAQQKDYSRARSYSRDAPFCPQNDFEEAVLLLLISESLLHDDACVSLFEENKQKREQTIIETNTIYNLLCVALTKKSQYGFLLECYERGIQLAYRQFHLWFQYGLALICNGKYKKALVVLKRCHELEPENEEILLYCAKISINNLREYEEAVKFTEKALQLFDDPLTKANCFFAMGISYSQLASQASNHSERQSLLKKSIQALEQAHYYDNCEVDILCQLALSHALARQISNAMTVIDKALKLDPIHRDSLFLLALLLSAQKRFVEGLEIIDAALVEHPEDFSLLQAKVQLTEECYGGEQSLSVCQEMLQAWNEIYGENVAQLNFLYQEADNKSATSSVMKKATSESKLSETGRSLMRLKLAEDENNIDDDEVSSITATVNFERSLSELALSAVSGTRLKTPAAVALLARIWLTTADVYLNMENTNEASNCISEASSIFPVSPEVLYMRGRMSHIGNNLEEAKVYYQSALAVSPKHISSLENLGIIHHETGSYVMAEKYLREALAIEPTNPFIWQALGIVLASLEKHDEASKCFFMSLDLESTNPILPFTIIPRLFKDDDV